MLVIYALLVVQPFHAQITGLVPYYREFFAICFVLVTLTEVPRRNIKNHPALRPDGELFLLILFTILLCFYAALDPLTNLYGAPYTDASERLSSVSPRLYVLRNAILYLPMLTYLAVGGLQRRHLHRIALVSAAIAPVSLWAFVSQRGIGIDASAQAIAGLGGAGLAYNSYVPYLTFPITAALFLAIDGSKVWMRAFATLSAAVLVSYVAASTSRQSLLFVLIAGAAYWYTTRGETRRRLLGTFLVILASGLAAALSAASDSGSLEALTREYSDLRPLRLEAAINGLQLMDLDDYVAGAGLSSVVVSGPHNDFIRWMQRIGIGGMIIAFVPFVTALWRSVADMRASKKPLVGFLFLAVSFTIYHSLFGYPREDAFQALYAFLGLGMWLGYQTGRRRWGRMGQSSDTNSYTLRA